MTTRAETSPYDPPIRRISPDVVRALRLPALALVGMLIGGVLWYLVRPWAHVAWMLALIGTGSVVVTRTIRGALHGRWAADVIATLAILTAAVMQQPLAGLIIVIMQTGGEALERYAEGRASDAVRSLEADQPHITHMVRDGQIIDVSVDTIAVGDTLMIRPGEFVPCDGVVEDGTSALDTSRLTGEPLPVSIRPGSEVHSGSVNGNRAFTMRATAVAGESQYARIVELVRTAQLTKAPFQRLADRYAVWFTPLTLVIGISAALLSGEWTRFLAVLVVATPCPLLLAPPIAIIGGINRAARRQVIVRTGAAIEQLALVDVAVLDKTGTLTVGKPRVRDVTPVPPFTSHHVLVLAASAEQGSSHLLARTLVDAALAQGVSLVPVEAAVEAAGQGIVGRVEGRAVAVGSRRFIMGQLHPDAAPTLTHIPENGLTAYVSVDGQLAGVVSYADALRPGVRHVLTELSTLGLRRTLVVSGDSDANARAVAEAVGIVDVRGDVSPAEKVATVRDLTRAGSRVLMIGDGTNDAPALSAASVGIALAGHGGGVTAEAADVILLADDLQRIPDVIRIGHRTMRIAQQSVWVGLGLSGVAMGVAAVGLLPPTAGALLQEVIDVAVILNALRASADPVTTPATAASAPPPAHAALATPSLADTSFPDSSDSRSV